MGAELTEQRAEGRTVNEAYAIALAEATSYYGSQDGYSGAINSKMRGFYLVQLPARMTYAKFQALLEDASFIEGSSEDLRGSIEWRQNILDQNKVKRSERPAVRKLIQADQKALKQALRDEAKIAERIAKSGFSEYDFEEYVRIYNDKWDSPLAVALSTREAKPSKRGRRIFVFFGYAPC